MEHQLEHQIDLVQSIIVPYFNFALFIAAVVFLFRKPLIAMAQARRSSFVEASREAREALEQAQVKFNEMKIRHDALDAELAAFQSQSETNARDDAKKQIAEAERLSQQIKSETQKIAEEAIARARYELRQEMAQAAVKQAAVQIEANLGQNEKQSIIKSRITDLRGYQA